MTSRRKKRFARTVVNFLAQLFPFFTKKRGVALIVRNQIGLILVLRELETKPEIGKHAGMFSIPMETVEPGEHDVQAIKRLIEEELPGLISKIKVVQTRFGLYRVGHRTWATLYTATASDDSLPDPQAVGVAGHQWVSPPEALALHLRRGAREMIEDYISGRSFVVRRNCR
ncbi:MAG: hypothetical protein G01um101430_531 [Parcubacteria group bacterium Gr01-1014_30]|nr:MAG: hypothetical protein G01um101430_531 [Parcubacteria group bacterium Gr01-1014_30]